MPLVRASAEPTTPGGGEDSGNANQATARPLALARWGGDLALVALVAATRFGFRHGLLDDSYIVLAVVRNALGGHGPHLDPGSGDAVLSTLLWPALLAALSWLGLDPTVALGLLGFAAELALALLVRRLVETLTGSLVAAVFAAAVLATHPVLLLPALGGMETPLYLALVAGAALALARRRFAALAFAAALLAWIRFDGALAAAIFLAAGALVGRRPAVRWTIAGAALAGAAPLVHRLLFDRWLPDSINAKLGVEVGSWADGAAQIATEFARATVGMSAYWLVAPVPHLVLPVLALFGVARLLRRQVSSLALATLLLWTVAYVALFTLSGRGYARNFPWYFAPPLLALALLAAIGMVPVLEAAARALGRWPPALPCVLPLAIWFTIAPSVGGALDRVSVSFAAHRERSYAAAALWLGRYGPARSVASNEIGALAWFSPPGTEIVDLFGISRRPEERELSALELVRRRRPAAIVTRIDFRYRREIESALPGAYVWVRAGAIDIGLEPTLAARLEPRAPELESIYRGLGDSKF